MQRALKPDGILLIHISNRFFGLEPVLAEEARARGWTAAIRLDPGPPEEGIDDLTGSNWVALTATPQRMAAIDRRPASARCCERTTAPGCR